LIRVSFFVEIAFRWHRFFDYLFQWKLQQIASQSTSSSIYFVPKHYLYSGLRERYVNNCVCVLVFILPDSSPLHSLSNMVTRAEQKRKLLAPIVNRNVLDAVTKERQKEIDLERKLQKTATLGMLSLPLSLPRIAQLETHSSTPSTPVSSPSQFITAVQTVGATSGELLQQIAAQKLNNEQFEARLDSLLNAAGDGVNPKKRRRQIFDDSS
jgi:hypothetical protein